MKTATQKLALVCAIALVTAACGKGSDLSVTGPSAIGGGSGTTSGATISGRVNGGSGLAKTDMMATGGTLTVTVAGTTITATVDATGAFTLTGVPAGDIRLEFHGPGTNATVTITVGAQEQIQIAVTVSNNSARVESEHHSGSSNRAELKGSITAIDAAARTLRVSGALVDVPAEATIRRGSQTLQFADLQIGDKVEIRGTVEATSVRATEVKVDGERRGQLTERKGLVSGLAGTCPDLTFTIGTTKVTTSGSTYFKEGACTAVQNGVAVEVKGQPQADGSIVAMQVKQDDDDDDQDENEDDDDDDDDDDRDEVELKGAVSALGTTPCPTITFVVRSTTVSTTSATRFDGIACTAIQNGRIVEVKGTRQPDGTVVATRVELED
jgi:hypothetical protein